MVGVVPTRLLLVNGGVEERCHGIEDFDATHVHQHTYAIDQNEKWCLSRKKVIR